MDSGYRKCVATSTYSSLSALAAVGVQSPSPL